MWPGFWPIFPVGPELMISLNFGIIMQHKHSGRISLPRAQCGKTFRAGFQLEENDWRSVLTENDHLLCYLMMYTRLPAIGKD